MSGIYDEDEMVHFINAHASSPEIVQLDFDNLVYLSDLVDEYLETRGYLDNDDINLDEFDALMNGEDTDMYDFVVKNIKRDDFENFPLSLKSFVEFLNLQEEYYETLNDEFEDNQDVNI